MSHIDLELSEFHKLSDTVIMFISFRLVNSVLEEELKEIHAFSQKTLTPEQWEKQKAS